MVITNIKTLYLRITRKKRKGKEDISEHKILQNLIALAYQTSYVERRLAFHVQNMKYDIYRFSLSQSNWLYCSS